MKKRILALSLLLLFLFAAGCTAAPQKGEVASASEDEDGEKEYVLLGLGDGLYLTMDRDVSKRKIVGVLPPEGKNGAKPGQIVDATLSTVWMDENPKQTAASGWEIRKEKVASEKISLKDAAFLSELTTDNYMLVDVRTPAEYAEGHVAGAVNLPLQDLDADLTNSPPDPGKKIIVYCRSGSRSAKAAAIFVRHGFFVLDAGGVMNANIELVK